VGGTVPYSYLWYNSSGGSPSSVISSTDTASALSSGIYFVVVTDANGCDTSSSVQVLSANTSLFSTTQISEVVCKGDASGYLIADAGGGFAPYTYEWSTAAGGPIKVTSGVYTTDTLQNITSDIYLLDITDHLGCKVSQMSLTVNEPLQALVIDTIYLIDSIACFGDNAGRALGVKSGGDASYVYLWDNGESTLEASHLPSGYHTLSVTDYRGCEVLDSIYIPESSEIISSLVIEESISCYGSVNGVVSVSTIGGYPLYLYSWSNQNYVDTGLVDTAFALSYGVYALTTEDSLGCSVVDSVSLTEPDLLTMEAEQLSRVSCKGLSDGLAFSSAYGGTLPYTFNWADATGTIIATGHTVNTLSAGLHTVVVTDARGCSASDTVLIHEPLNALAVDVSVLDSVYCNGASTGRLEANASGGTPFVGTSSLYTYLWDDALQASQTTVIAVNLLANVYSVLVTDSRGCTATAMADITNVTNTMYTVADFDSVSCYGLADASASVVALEGHAPYIYSWVGPNGYTSA
ncbi:MAG: SprB repeat-containing protein, partial [Flavobacteriales bacterium]